MLSSTKYPNNSRVVAGTPTLFPDDVVLLCDTTANPVIINLLPIPANHWSTAWRLYVVDHSHNAAVNSITINAPVGFLINGGASYVINVDAETTLVQISADKDFILTSSNPAAGGGSVDTASNVGLGADVFKQKVGTDLEFRTIIGAGGIVATQNANDITLTGGGGEANTMSNVGAGTGNVFKAKVGVDFEMRTLQAGDDMSISTLADEVFFSSSAVTPQTITHAGIVADMAAGTLRPGKPYLISDAGGADQGVIIHACANNEISIFGCGRFFNADYQGVGNYGGLAAYVGPPLGIWNASLVVVPGNVVIWNNDHYLNITGVNPGPPDLNPADWGVAVIKAGDTGFIGVADQIIYSVTLNLVIKREDNLLNSVEFHSQSTGGNTIASFPWGNEQIFSNTLTDQSRSSGFTNYRGNFAYNILQGGAIIFNSATSPGTQVQNNFILGDESSVFMSFETIEANLINDNVVHQSSISFASISGGNVNIIGNNLTGGSRIQGGDLDGSSNISFNTLESSSRFLMDAGVLGTNIDITLNTIRNKSTIVCELAVSPNFTALQVAGCKVAGGDSIAVRDIDYVNLTCDSNASNFEVELDFSDPAIFNAATFTLTIPGGQNFAGRYKCINSNGLDVSHIFGLIGGRPCQFYPGPTPALNVLRFVAVPVATPAVGGDIVSTQQNQGPAITCQLHTPLGADYFQVTPRGEPVNNSVYLVFWTGTNILV